MVPGVRWGSGSPSVPGLTWKRSLGDGDDSNVCASGGPLTSPRVLSRSNLSHRAAFPSQPRREALGRSRARSREREEEGSEARLGSRGGTTGSPNLHPWPRPLPPPPLVRRRTSRLSSRRRIFGNAGKLESPSWGKGPRGERGRGEKGGGRGRPSPKYSEGSGMRGR